MPTQKQIRAVLQRLLEFVIGSIVFLLMMAGTLLLMAVLEPSFSPIGSSHRRIHYN
jgi:hypothetical protein